jgi:uncharacterized protein (DUF1501 family)
MSEIEYAGARPLDEEEKALLKRFEKFEEEALDKLDAGAQQIIQLVTGLLGLTLAALALGDAQFAAALTRPLAVGCAWLSVLALLVALLAAAWGQLPQEYLYRAASLSDKKARYARMVQHKSRAMYVAFVAFGFGVATFAGLVLSVLLGRR